MSGIILKTASALYRQQITHIAVAMRELVAQKEFSPLINMIKLNQLKKQFAKVEAAIYQCCSLMDHTSSAEKKNKAMYDAHCFMNQMIELKNDVRDLVANEQSAPAEPEQKTASQKMAALDVIRVQYKTLIADDLILKGDFRRLMQSICISNLSAMLNCKIIVKHLIAEIKEDAQDNQRMADESLLSMEISDKAETDLHEHLHLQHDLEEYQTAYLAPSDRK